MCLELKLSAIIRTSRGINVNQATYTNRIVDHAGFGVAAPATTPLPAGFHAGSSYASKTPGPTAP